MKEKCYPSVSDVWDIAARFGTAALFLGCATICFFGVTLVGNEFPETFWAFCIIGVISAIISVGSFAISLHEIFTIRQVKGDSRGSGESDATLEKLRGRRGRYAIEILKEGVDEREYGEKLLAMSGYRATKQIVEEMARNSGTMYWDWKEIMPLCKFADLNIRKVFGNCFPNNSQAYPSLEKFVLYMMNKGDLAGQGV